MPDQTNELTAECATSQTGSSAESGKDALTAGDDEILSILARTESLLLKGVTELSSIVSTEGTNSLREPHDVSPETASSGPIDVAKTGQDHAQVLSEEMSALEARVFLQGATLGLSVEEMGEMYLQGESEIKRHLAKARDHQVRKIVPAVKEPELLKEEMAPLSFRPDGC